ncbi:(1-_4)-alpha-D-glucan 1-alpha-D-glucosylmutase [Spinactinospora alkalitolerans]|uniref:(1->4)-alpha-D-glucan 1-alpha-D-glucosylmutase n=1 Tax=Spinactinospora alkalitolerans TaxID=687207 RepID=A0A852TVF3_9ACTN|nr:malto-oligosyltrehalose synthase [Spinactinospora alkalitolerans]NYE47277.1 (1->4)-alpha-D-glucan 1-alpha-D-glucosylmutase [Spinactinospora alkalitolerans]
MTQTPPSSPPSSTYRLQLRPGFTLTDAAEVADYLRRLGAGAVYLSPILTAAPGSTHGYDVVDPTRVSDALGGDAARRELVERLRGLGMGIVVDIVPNHMSVAAPEANPWWWDVLEHGRRSRYAGHFDVDWASGPLLVPVLADDGDGGAAALQELTIDDGRLAYFEHRFPIAPGTGASGDDPGEVHRRQHYRLVSWRRGDAELNYRRFFDIATLAAVRVEEPDVFAETHGEILRWAAAGEVDGLRVDHPDGLCDPGGYARRLRSAFGGWIVLEKILAAGESPPASWPVAGTTGYDALREVCGVFVDPDGCAPLTGLAAELGVPTDFEAVQNECRRAVATTVLAAEVRRIAGVLESEEAEPPGGAPPERSDPGAPASGASERIEEAVAELLAAFPVYRSYLPEGEGHWSEAVRRAGERRPDLAGALEFLDARVRADARGELARRIQQTSGMVVAKGTEDTAFYRYTRFVALNEVGGAPERFGVPPEEFHARAAEREASWPRAMTALSTHDTKRSEDVRARLAALAEVPGEFAGAVRRWSREHGLSEPSLNLLAWQTLVGAWPISAARLRGYLAKAAKEAKLRTSWVDPDPVFEEEVDSWPERVLSDAELSADVAAFADRIRGAGRCNALGQKLVQLTAPGVPDLYQGSELWELSLVDPDNRRPVDFAVRRVLLERLEGGWLPRVDATGAAKMHVVRTALHLRRDRDLTGYRPLAAAGPAARHALAFARGAAHDVVAVATRLPLGLEASGGWRDTVLPLPSGSGRWSDLLTGRDLAPDSPDGYTTPRLSELLDRYPVALLLRRPD